MAIEHRSSDWTEYKMVYDDPHRQVEPAEREIATVDDVLAALREQGIIESVG